MGVGGEATVWVGEEGRSEGGVMEWRCENEEWNGQGGTGQENGGRVKWRGREGAEGEAMGEEW